MTDDANANTGDSQKSHWGNSIEFLLSCMMVCIGLGNIWRFPFIVKENGGGAFLIPYVIVLILIGRPIYFMEMVLGQFTSSGPAKMYYKMSPVFRGIGIWQIFGCCMVLCYYSSLAAITLFYLFKSFTNNFPWTICWESWNEYLTKRNLTCVDKYTVGVLPNNTISSSEMYYRREVLQEKDNIDDGLGAPNLILSLYLLLSYVVTFLITVKGIKSSGKASYFLAIFPYVVMICLLIRAATLPGAATGMYYFIETDFSKILDIKVWYAAVSQCFYSLTVGFGNIITLASFNKFDHNINRDALIITSLDTVTSLLSGITMFGILGNLAYELNVPPSEVISAGGGTGLAFISYPNALSKFTFIPWFFAIAFFVMLFILCIGCLVCMQGSLNALIKDLFPTQPDWLISGYTACVLFLFSLIYVTPGGQYALGVADIFAGTVIIFSGAICEVLVVSYVYGAENLCQDLEFMTKKKVSIYWKFTWKISVPVLLIVIFVYYLFTFPPLVYGIDNLPTPIGLKVFGWGIFAIAVIQMVGWILYYLYTNRHYPGIKVITKTFSTENWGPEGQKETNEWKAFKEEKKRQKAMKTKFKTIKSVFK